MSRMGKLANRSVVLDQPRWGSIIAGIAETVLVDTSVATTVTVPPAREHADFFNVVITKGEGAVSIDYGPDAGPIAEFSGLGEARRFEFDARNANVWRLVPNFQSADLPTSGLNFKGTWDAATNTPTLVSGVGVSGDWWIVDIAGNTDLDGHNEWDVLDWAVFSESNTWERAPYGNVVVSFGPAGNKRKGDVDPQTGDYTAAMVGAAPASHTSPSTHVPSIADLADGVDYVIRNKQWDVSLHPLMGNNPHQVTAAQTGAPTIGQFNSHIDAATHVPVMPPSDGSMYGMRNQAWDIVEEGSGLPEPPPIDNELYGVYNQTWQKIPGADFAVMYGIPSMSGAWNTTTKLLSNYSESFATSDFDGFMNPSAGTIAIPVNGIYQIVVALTGRQGNDNKELTMRLFVRVVGGSQPGDYIVSVFDVATDKTRDRSFAATFTRDLYVGETISLVVNATTSTGTFVFEAITFELHQFHEIP